MISHVCFLLFTFQTVHRTWIAFQPCAISSASAYIVQSNSHSLLHQLSHLQRISHCVSSTSCHSKSILSWKVQVKLPKTTWKTGQIDAQMDRDLSESEMLRCLFRCLLRQHRNHPLRSLVQQPVNPLIDRRTSNVVWKREFPHVDQPVDPTIYNII